MLGSIRKPIYSRWRRRRQQQTNRMCSKGLMNTVISLILSFVTINHIIIIVCLMKTYIQREPLYFSIFEAKFWIPRLTALLYHVSSSKNTLHRHLTAQTGLFRRNNTLICRVLSGIKNIFTLTCAGMSGINDSAEHLNTSLWIKRRSGNQTFNDRAMLHSCFTSLRCHFDQSRGMNMQCQLVRLEKLITHRRR